MKEKHIGTICAVLAFAAAIVAAHSLGYRQGKRAAWDEVEAILLAFAELRKRETPPPTVTFPTGKYVEDGKFNPKNK